MSVDSPRTLAGLLRQRAVELPQQVPYRFLKDGETESQQLTYASLDGQARAIAARLLAVGSPGQPVLMLYGAGLEFIAGLFGCLYAGMIAVPLIPPRRRQPLTTLAAMAADAGAKLALTTHDLLARLLPQLDQEPGLRELNWLPTDELEQAGVTEVERVPDCRPDDVAALLYTSGSTSAPKGVMLTQRGLLGAPLVVPPGVDPNWPLTWVNWMPMHHIAGLGSVLQPVRVGKAAAILLPAEAVLERPVRWLRAISRYQAHFANAPNFLYQFCADGVGPDERADLDLRGWFIARCNAETVRPETVEQFTTAYAPHGFRPEAFMPVYGLSEYPGVTGHMAGRAALARAFDRAALAQNRVSAVEPRTPGALRLVSNGRPGQGVTVRIVDPTTRRLCAAAEVGEVWVAGEYVAAGYWRRPDATAESFQARTADSGEGPFLRTGDLGFLHDGELYICGRLKDTLIIRGQNYYAVDIEAAAAGSHPDLGAAAAAFAAPLNGAAGAEQVVIYHEVRPGCTTPDVEAISAAIRRAVASEMLLPVYAVVLVRAGGLPRTPVGKIRRFVCRDEFMAQPPHA